MSTSRVLGAGLLAGLAVLLSLFLTPARQGSPTATGPAAPQLVSGYGKLPMSFEPNVGQSDAGILYLSRGQGYVLGLTENAALLRMTSNKTERKSPSPPVRGFRVREPRNAADQPIETVTLKLSLVGSNPKPVLTAEAPQEGVSNYMLGNDPANDHLGVPNYGAVRYSAVYPGIDWLIYGNPQHLEYDLVIAPQADPGQIRLKLEGADALALDGDGNLQVTIQGHTIVQHKPVSYQTIEGKRRPVASRYVLDEPSRQVAFEVADYDRDAQLVIDPSLYYSTYLGGSGGDVGTAIAVDAAGNTYVAGFTNSTNFPTTGPQQAVNGGGSDDAFVTKLNASGTARIYSTYLGGSGDDYAAALAVDSAGNAYLAGETTSTNFPTTSPLQAVFGGYYDAFVTKLNAAGNARVYSTYLGGSNLDQANALAVDSAGNVYLAGFTNSTNFPTANALQAANAGDYDAFVTKINAAGSAKVYSTYLGGSSTDEAYALAVDSAGNVYVTGEAGSTNFPTTSPLQAANAGSYDAFVTKLNAAGNAKVYSTYLGGSGADYGRGIAIDSAGNVYVAGYTTSTNFPTTNPLQAANAGSDDAFVTKINAAGNAQVYSTYLGGSGVESAYAIAVDSAGNATVAGISYESDFPTTNAVQATASASGYNNYNGFVAKLNNTGSAKVYSTYLGGSADNRPYALALDRAGNVYVTGETSSIDFPTANALQPANAGIYDAFITKIGDPGAVHFGLAQYTVDESAGTITIAVERDAPTNQPATVAYYASAGTATAGSDFTAVSGTLSFAAGDTLKTFTVPILNDAIAEPDETINLTLANPGLSATLGSPSAAILTINDDDTPPANPAGLAFGSSTYSVSEAAGTATVAVQRTGSTNAAASVTVSTSNGTAIAGTNYTAVSTSLSWVAGDSGAKAVTIPITDNFTENGDRTVNLALSAPSGAALASPSTAVLTINDDEAGEPGLIQLGAVQYNVYENAGGVAVTLLRASGSSGPACVLASTANGTAVAGTDYMATSNTVCFSDNDASPKTVIVPIINNTTNTGTRSFAVNLSNPAGGGIGVPASAAVVITDDEAAASAGQVRFSSTTYSVSEATSVVALKLQRVNGTSGAVSVNVITANGSAVAPGDYTALAGTVVNWAAGDSADKTVNVTIINDTTLENGETFTATLNTPTGGVAIASPSTSTVTIVDNDTAAPKVAMFSFGSPEYSTVQGNEVAEVTINRTRSADGVASVDFARPADPLTNESGPVIETIRFEDGDASTKTVTIPLAGYNLQSGTQTVPLKLQNPRGASLDEGASDSTLVVEDGRAKTQSASSGGGALSPALLLSLALIAWRRGRRMA